MLRERLQTSEKVCGVSLITVEHPVLGIRYVGTQTSYNHRAHSVGH